ncbi:MAG: hypothetical protein AAFN70_19365 [Planctomycetota bacterium]
MPPFFQRFAIATLMVGCLGCGKNPLSEYFDSSNTTAESAADKTPESVLDGDNDSMPMVAIGKRLGELFENVLPTLDQTRELVDRHSDLPDNSRIPFKLDKQANSVSGTRCTTLPLFE